MSKADVLRALEESKAAVAEDRVTGTVKLLDEVESIIGRALAPDEMTSAGRALRAGVVPEEVANMFRERPPEVPDSSVKTRAALLTSARGSGQFTEVDKV